MTMTKKEAKQYIQTGNKVRFLPIGTERTLRLDNTNIKVPIPETVFIITSLEESQVNLICGNYSTYWYYGALVDELTKGTAILVDEDQGIYK